MLSNISAGLFRAATRKKDRVSSGSALQVHQTQGDSVAAKSTVLRDQTARFTVMMSNQDRQRVRQNPGATRRAPIERVTETAEHHGMEPRMANLATAVKFIQRDIKELKDELRSVRSDLTAIRTTDFRLLFGAIIAVALGPACLISKGFHWL